MTNKELSAKVAEARGDRCAVYESCCARINVGDSECGESCRHPKPYATDMNAAWELVE